MFSLELLHIQWRYEIQLNFEKHNTCATSNSISLPSKNNHINWELKTRCFVVNVNCFYQLNYVIMVSKLCSSEKHGARIEAENLTIKAWSIYWIKTLWRHHWKVAHKTEMLLEFSIVTDMGLCVGCRTIYVTEEVKK